MVCEFICNNIEVYNKHLGFFGVIFVALSALALVYRATELFEIHSRREIVSLRNRAISEIKRWQNIDDKFGKVARKNRNFFIRLGLGFCWWINRLPYYLALRLFVFDHNRIRKKYGMSYTQIELPRGQIVQPLLMQSAEEVLRQLPTYHRNNPVSDSRLIKFGVFFLFLGTLLLAMQTFPWC
jgi:hypothetical protein